MYGVLGNSSSHGPLRLHVHRAPAAAPVFELIGCIRFTEPAWHGILCSVSTQVPLKLSDSQSRDPGGRAVGGVCVCVNETLSGVLTRRPY
jgi:hypothetical protein